MNWFTDFSLQWFQTFRKGIGIDVAKAHESQFGNSSKGSIDAEDE